MPIAPLAWMQGVRQGGDGRQSCVMLRQFPGGALQGHPAGASDAFCGKREFTYWIYERMFGLGEWTAPT